MRESSETLDEISLTTSSYLSKKLTENLKGLTLVKKKFSNFF